MINNFLTQNPLELFKQWLDEAREIGALRPESMVLATATKSGLPSARVVLLKKFDSNGFVFFTNLNSRKSKELKENPQAALCIYWPILEKQIRIEGIVHEVSNEEADEYYATRPRNFQINSWSSKQSEILENKDQLVQRFSDFTDKFKDMQVPRPTFWSGFRLEPKNIEFWIEGEHRMHDRILYVKQSNGWQIKHLYP